MPSNLSPYAELCADFFTTLNTRFVELFQLKTFYSEDNILPDERYGVITLNSIEPDRDRSYGSEVRGGHQLLSMRMDLILKSGINTRVEGEAEKARLMLDLHHGIPKLKEYYDNDELVAEIRSDESFLGILAQAKRPQGNVANSLNSWIATVTCSATALILIKVDINGLHLMR